MVFSTGEAGIGKTTVADAFVAGIAARESVGIAYGQCVEHYGSGEAYQPVLEALGRWCRGPRGEGLRVLLRELAAALEIVTAETPLVLVLEDLHWSDYATLDLLAVLARRGEPTRLLVLGRYRPA